MKKEIRSLTETVNNLYVDNQLDESQLVLEQVKMIPSPSGEPFEFNPGDFDWLPDGFWNDLGDWLGENPMPIGYGDYGPMLLDLDAWWAQVQNMIYDMWLWLIQNWGSIPAHVRKWLWAWIKYYYPEGTPKHPPMEDEKPSSPKPPWVGPKFTPIEMAPTKQRNVTPYSG